MLQMYVLPAELSSIYLSCILKLIIHSMMAADSGKYESSTFSPMPCNTQSLHVTPSDDHIGFLPC